MNRKLTRTYLIAVVCASACAYIANYLLVQNLVGPRELMLRFRPRYNVKFNPSGWKSSGSTNLVGLVVPSKIGQRYQMVDQLLESGALLGMTESSVTELLGDPDAGITKQDSIRALHNAYGISNDGIPKRILDSSGNLTYWSYDLAPQRNFPARSIWFPMAFCNCEHWLLSVEFEHGKVISSRVSF